MALIQDVLVRRIRVIVVDGMQSSATIILCLNDYVTSAGGVMRWLHRWHRVLLDVIPRLVAFLRFDNVEVLPSGDD